MRSTSTLSQNSGSAIIIALIISLIAMAITLFVIGVNKSIVESSDMLLDKLNAKFRAESLINKIGFYVSTGRFTSDSVENPSVKGLPVKMSINGSLQKIDNNTEVTIRDAGSMMSIWAINPKVISNLLKLDNVSSQKIAVIKDSIMDWIDKDNLIHLNGAEAQYYKGKGYKYLPRNSFGIQSVYELKLVRGINSKIFKFLKGYLILAPKWHFNLSTMNEAMLSAATGIPYNLLKSLRFDEKNKELSLSDLEKETGKMLDPVYYQTFPAFVLDIHVAIRFNKALEKRSCVISFYQSEKSPFRVLKWEN